MTIEERARALRDALLHDMCDRRGFKRSDVDKETCDEWDASWLNLIAASLREAKRAVDEIGGTMKWTTNKPTVPGWYWWRLNAHDAAPFLTQIVGSDIRHGLSNSGDWAGPLEPPA